MNIIKTIISTFVISITFASCNNWLDVSPKSQILEEDHFSREGGYKDQLTGVYTKMASQEMYGLNMGIGFTEVLSHSYDVDGSGEWRYANDFDYTNSESESIISQIWTSSYNCISNLNLILENIDKVNQNIFSDNNYYLYKGEALGLRAFIHFNLMRLFACSPAMDNNANGVPYVTEYGTNVVDQKTVGQTMELIVADLEESIELLSQDSIKAGSSPYLQRTLRTCYFNYYAAVSTLASAYLWMGDKTNALKYASIIVDVIETNAYSRPFAWVHYSLMDSPNMYERDLAFTCEDVFYLINNKWEDITNFYFKSKGGTSTLSPSEEKAKAIYEIDKGYGNDYRYLRGYEQDGSNRYPCKFWYIERSAYNNIYPIIRMTDAVYIAAECNKDTDPTRAIELINLVRENRNLSIFPLSTGLTSAQIQEEIYKEIRKEYIAEHGELFFYYKRLNATEIKGSSKRPDKSVYVLPIPSSDVEFGGYTN